ncbi:unnamed protein product [Brassicogethes aeneus]|uniref:Uncharacterized protein n=1 Tax=Brassicogethes aeneus TaxID=1431903 RepID=A0A9P0FBK4_BRAAE|nr:unnamed protein product [Brassicogethes aeneus]
MKETQTNGLSDDNNMQSATCKKNVYVYAGRIQIRMSKEQSNLKAVSDMKTRAFLAALRRFQARRGHCVVQCAQVYTCWCKGRPRQRTLASNVAVFISPSAFSGTTWHFLLG